MCRDCTNKHLNILIAGLAAATLEPGPLANLRTILPTMACAPQDATDEEADAVSRKGAREAMPIFESLSAADLYALGGYCQTMARLHTAIERVAEGALIGRAEEGDEAAREFVEADGGTDIRSMLAAAGINVIEVEARGAKRPDIRNSPNFS